MTVLITETYRSKSCFRHDGTGRVHSKVSKSLLSSSLCELLSDKTSFSTRLEMTMSRSTASRQIDKLAIFIMDEKKQPKFINLTVFPLILHYLYRGHRRR